MKYFANMTMKDIGREIGLSQTTLRKWHKQVLVKLRARIESEME